MLDDLSSNAHRRGRGCRFITCSYIFVLVAIVHPRTINSFGLTRAPIGRPQNPPPDHDVIVIGGSIVGLATAVAISSSSSSSSSPPDVAVYERARRAEPIGALLSLFPNGLTALRSINSTVAEQVERVSIPLRTSEIKRSTDGKLLRCIESNASSDGSNGTFLCWYQLQNILSSALQRLSENAVKFGAEFVSYSVDASTGYVTVTCRDRNNNDAEFHKTCRVLIGADGVQSTVRRQLSANREDIELNSYNRTIFRALVNIDTIDNDSIVPPNGTAVIYKSDEVGQIFKIWTASDRTLAITATVNSDEDDAAVREWNENETKERMSQVYAGFAPEVRDLIRRIPEASIYANAVCDMEFLEHWSNGPVVVIGDAAHSMTPSLGQGANIGLEDAAEIGYLLRDDLGGKSNRYITETINNFCTIRQDRVQEIHTASRQQALNKNKKDTTLGSFLKSNPSFFERLYEWQPISSLHSANKVISEN
eukprot:CAMPEP_0183718706 /NCGR_PEP_ID=MMETSP0737-20130205/11893_1 /TAXON_ID=385413 /ORGANISM="Thalassiosira miniscula, Strain CCMP1093" /LENGTH=478 /DNA_ID=CAMNT_0025948315 /DNA_START=85 /DNA_END=1521 /DNA_ORIENTATION=+